MRKNTPDPQRFGRVRARLRRVFVRTDEGGLTYLEMLVVLAVMAILALGALPYAHNRVKRQKEIELERTLKMLRGAIDRYNEYARQGLIEPWDLEWNMYPEDLDTLVEGVEVRPAVDQEPVTIRFLRDIPIDPITGEREWDCRGYEDDVDERSSSCDDIYDVFSTSPDLAMDETYYRDW